MAEGRRGAVRTAVLEVLALASYAFAAVVAFVIEAVADRCGRVAG